MAREPVSRKLRFEIFKRDKFTCQYCGAKAPDVVLQIDHVRPVAKGGTSDTLNLVAACIGCNSGKAARLLDDRSVVERHRARLAELEERREQLEMMLQWRDDLERTKIDTVQAIADRIEERGVFGPNESGLAFIRKWLRRYSFDEILAALDASFDSYMKWNGAEPDEEAWELAFHKIPAVCNIARQTAEKPYLRDLFYIQGILRKRLRNKRFNCVQALEEMLRAGATINELQWQATQVDTWEEFCGVINGLLEPVGKADAVDAEGEQ